jgi:hypothetical protein
VGGVGRLGPEGAGLFRQGPVDVVVGGVDLAGRGPGRLRRPEDQSEGGVDGDPGPPPGSAPELAVVLHPRRHLGVGHVHDQGPLDHEGHHGLGHHPSEDGPLSEGGGGERVEGAEAR